MGQLGNLRGGIDAATMKKIAIITMFIDHLTLTMLEIPRDAQGTRIMYTFPGGEVLDQLGRGIGRLAFPVFCFLIVEGFLHTRNRWKYLVRLLVFAAAAQYPFCMMAFPNSTRRHADTIFTLAAGYVVIWCVHTLARFLPDVYRPVPSAALSRAENGDGQVYDNAMFALPAPFDNMIVRAVLFLVPGAAITFGICRLVKWTGCDYSYGGVLCILLLYLLYRVRDLSLGASWAWLTYYNENEVLAFTGFFLIRCYNGKRGKQNKYFFYLFYPGHLLLLYLLRRAVFGA